MTVPGRAQIDELLGVVPPGLRRMQLPSGLFCHEVRAPSWQPRGRSLRYTAMVLIGLSRAEPAGFDHGLERRAIETTLWSQLDSRELSVGDLGLLLWLDARTGCGRGEEVLARLNGALPGAGGLGALEGMELGWIATGLALQVAAGGPPGSEALLGEALRQLLEARRAPGGLFYHHGLRSNRRRFPNFATQIYGVLALSTAADFDLRALPAARRAADRLLALQLPDGGWPWLFDAERGRVVEPYEVYSVHQDAMAPMALLGLWEETGDDRYREAVRRGLWWLWGENALGVSMVEDGFVRRSIRRRRPIDRLALYANTAGSLVGRGGAVGADGALEVNSSDRPYHLGWVLEAWSGRRGALD